MPELPTINAPNVNTSFLKTIPIWVYVGGGVGLVALAYIVVTRNSGGSTSRQGSAIDYTPLTTFQQLDSKVNTLFASVADLTTQLGQQASEQTASLNSAIADLQSNAATVTAAINTDIASLKSTVSNLNGLTANLSAQLATTIQRVTSAESLIGGLRTDLTSVLARVTSVEAVNTSQSGLITTLQGLAAGLRTDVNSALSRVGTLESLLNTPVSGILPRLVSLEAFKTSIATIDSRVKALESSVATATQATIPTLQLTLNNVSFAVGDTTRGLIHDVATLTQSVTDLRTWYNTLNDAYMKLTTSVNTITKTTIPTINTRIDSAFTSITGLQNQISGATGINASITSIWQVINNPGGIKDTLLGLQNQITQIRKGAYDTAQWKASLVPMFEFMRQQLKAQNPTFDWLHAADQTVFTQVVTTPVDMGAIQQYFRTLQYVNGVLQPK